MTPIERALWALFEHTTASVEIGDPQGRLEHVNPRFSEITGWLPHEAQGRLPAELLRSHVHDPSFYETMWTVLSQGQVWRGELIGRRKDGSLVHQLTKVVPVVADDGTLERFVAIKEPLHEADPVPVPDAPGDAPPEALDVVLSRLRASELRYRTMVRSAADAILVSDMRSAFFVEVNPAACDMFGYTVAELRRLNGRSLCAPEESATVDGVSHRLLTTGQGFAPQVQMCRKDGSRFWGSLRIAAYHVQGQQLYVAIVRDVTEQVQRQQQLAESNARLQQARERLLQSERLAALGQISATVAHEINNPLQFVDLNLGAVRELLAAHGVPAEVTALLDDVREGVDRISAITRDLASFSRVTPPQMAPVALDEVVQRACRMANTEIRHRARLVLDLQTRRPVVGDHGKLTQLVTNLVVNAAHAIVEGHADRNRITVTTRERGDALVLVVEDTGRGIPVELRERIFEPFVHTISSGGRSLDGTQAERGGGLGLAVCMDVVRLHQGTIQVDSEVGRGARFEVRLPLPDVVATASEPTPPAPAPRRGRLLLIDDDALVLRGLGRLLSLSHEVVLANGGQEGLEVLRRDRDFDAILCDLMMPITDGPEVHAVISDWAPELLPRLAFCSGGAFTPRVRAFVDSVDNVVLGKPIRRDELLQALDALMARGGRLAAPRA